MQKLINTVALLSGLVSLSVVSAGSYLYLNKDAIVEDARRKVTAAITVAITDALPGMIDAALPEPPEIPEIPKQTGGPIPL